MVVYIIIAVVISVIGHDNTVFVKLIESKGQNYSAYSEDEKRILSELYTDNQKFQ